MIDTPHKFNVLAVTPEQNSAQAIESLLRGAGHNLRVQWRTDAAPLAQRGEPGPNTPDLICCGGTDTPQGLEAAIADCLQAWPGVPIIALARPQLRLAMLQAGASDLADPAQPGLLTRIFERGLQDAAGKRELTEARARLAQCRMRLDAIVGESQEARATLVDGLHAEVNPGYARLFGFDKTEELLKIPLLDLVAAADRDAVKHYLAALLGGGAEPEPVAFHGQRADDSRIAVTMQGRCAQAGEGHQLDIFIQRPAAAAPAPPSGALAARAALYQALEAAAPTAAQGRGLVVLRLDNFGRLQEQLGLAAADRLSDELAAALTERLAQGERGFRFGPAEFVVLTQQRAGGPDLAAAADALQRWAQEQRFGGNDGAGAAVIAHVGVCTLSADGGNDKRLLQALRAARGELAAPATAATAGGAARDPATPPAAEPAQPAPAARKTLREALAKGRFKLAFENVMSLEGKPDRLLDVLVRPPEPTDPQLMPLVDQWSTARTLEVQQAAAQRGEPATLFVTLSEATVAEAPDFVAWLGRQNGAVGSGSLQFVISQETATARLQQAQTLAQSLRASGFGVAVGAYGGKSGYEAVLSALAPEFVRLDGMGTESLVDGNEAGITEAVRLAAAQGAKIIAAHVGDANAMARLWQAGVQYAQSGTAMNLELQAGTA